MSESSRSPALPYEGVDQLLARIPGPAGEGVRALYRAEAETFARSPGSARAHQAWPGGYVGHIEDCLNLVRVLYPTLAALRPLPFQEWEALLVMALHDVEKPARYVHQDPEASGDKASRSRFRQSLLERWHITLTPEQQNALRYVEGEGADYRPGERVMNELAAFCHSVDVLSARMWHDYPGREGDPWVQGESGATAGGLEPELREHLLGVALESPDALGEAFRSYTFVTRPEQRALTGSGRELLGCYETFEVRPEFRDITEESERLAHPLMRALWGELDFDSLPEETEWGVGKEELRRTVLKSNGWLDVCWHWDGDGTLLFRHPRTGILLRNSDCKCTEGWERREE